MFRPLLIIALFFSPVLTQAAESNMGLTGTERGIYTVLIFIIAYVFVVVEEFTHLRKSKPVIVAAAIIWAHVAYLAKTNGIATERLTAAVEYNLVEYAQLMLFLLVAITYVNTMAERNVFNVLRDWLIARRFSYKQLFWITGGIAFFLSAVADNLTTSLLIGAVVLAVGAKSPSFVNIGFINIVVAANAGGAFSPFGDITTLMVWQSEHAEFFDFFSLFLPSVVNYLVPAAFMSAALPSGAPKITIKRNAVALKPGAFSVCLLFLLTIITAVSFEQFLNLPPFLGMMAGFGLLMIFAFVLKEKVDGEKNYDIFERVREAEWDTLLFFFGVVFAVGGLGFIGYLELASNGMYNALGTTSASMLVGLLSSVIDNIPIVFAVLSMNPDMNLFQWLLMTLSAGVGGSLLSVGSAAGVALMGQSQGKYSFFSHLKWTPYILLGFFASIFTHYLVNS